MRNQAEQSSPKRSDRDRFVAFAFAAADVLIELDIDFRVSYATGATQALHRSKTNTLIGAPLVDLVATEDRDRLRATLEAIPKGGRMAPIRVRLAGQGSRLVVVSGYQLPDFESHLYLAISFDTAVPSEARTTLARRDGETGLFEKEGFGALVGERLETAKARGDDVELTLLDLEKISDLRERVAAEEIDAFIAGVSETLRANSVEGDTAGRFDGNTFGLVHEKALDIDAIKARIGEDSRRIDPAGAGFEVQAATVDLDAGDAAPQDAAKAILYTITKFSEREGDDFSIASLSQGCDLMVRDTMSQMAEFKRIVATGNFSIALQPIVDLKTRKVHHYEALARFESLGRATSPFSLITFAEETGVIGEFDMAMARRSVALIVEAEARGERLNLAINLSGRSLGSPAFIEELLAFLKDHDGLRRRIWFEITESAKIADLAATNVLIQELRSAGHAVCLDDFGAGAAAFQYLRALDVDVVKIDGVYVREALSTPTGKPFLKAMAGLCTDLGIAVVAEMIENEETAEFMQECGVRYGQGYLFGKPTPAPDYSRQGAGEVIHPPTASALKRARNG